MPSLAPEASTATAVETVVVPFSLDDDSAVTWAVHQFEDAEVLVVTHPNRRALAPADLAELRERFAGQLAGRYAVSAAPPALRFVRVG